MTSTGFLFVSAMTLLLSMRATGQELLKKPPTYVGTAVFNSPPPLFHELGQFSAQFPAHDTGLNRLQLTEIYGKLKAYATHAIEVIKSRLKGTEMFVMSGMMGGVLVYAFNLLKSLFGKCKTPVVNHVSAGKPYDNYVFGSLYKSADDDVDDAKSRGWTAVANGQCLQKAACLLGRHTGRYNNANDVFRFLRRLPSQVVVDAFLKSADGYDDCSVYDCN